METNQEGVSALTQWKIALTEGAKYFCKFARIKDYAKDGGKASCVTKEARMNKKARVAISIFWGCFGFLLSSAIAQILLYLFN